MKSALVVLAIVFLAGAAQAQMSGGNMGGMQHDTQGMQHGGQGMQHQSGQQATTPGGKLFGEQCAACHPDGGNSIVPNLPVKGSKKLANRKIFVKFIRNPKMPDGSAGSMPAFTRSKISDKQARELFEYVSKL